MQISTIPADLDAGGGISRKGTELRSEFSCYPRVAPPSGGLMMKEKASHIILALCLWGILPNNF